MTPLQRLPGPIAALLSCLLLSLLVAGCGSTRAERDAPAARPSVLLISIDGFHPDYLLRGHTPRLAELAAEGVRAQWMTPSYPSLTFPNHYTLVTGLRPDRHGIVDNRMRDPTLGGFHLGNKAAVGDGRWWDEAEPLWVSARRAGLRTATMFWPGSEAEIRGLRPHLWLPYSRTPSPQQRVDQVLEWLAAPERPQFVTLYFEHVDITGHDHGPQSDALDRELQAIDAVIGRLLDGMQQRGLHDDVDVIVVSDHGMARRHAEPVAVLDRYVDLDMIELVSAGQVVGIEPKPGQAEAVERRLLGRHDRFECWRKDALPAQWHYGRHPRVPAIVCQADEGMLVTTARRLRSDRIKPGAHGYDPTLPSMRALFIAAGPSFQRARVIEPIDNVDVYPLLARLLGVEPQPHDGDPRRADSMLR